MHRSESLWSNDCWHRVSKFNGPFKFGPPRHLDDSGTRPTIAITRNGYVIMIWTGGNTKQSSDLHHKVGEVNLAGDENQTIE